MYVFVTGATGVVGRATARELLHWGHTVSAASSAGPRADAVRALGARPVDVVTEGWPAVARAMGS